MFHFKFLMLLSLTALSVQAAPRELISCKLENGVRYKLTNLENGFLNLKIEGLPSGNPSVKSFMTGLGITESALPKGGSVSAEISFPSNETCLFPTVPTLPQFTCEATATSPLQMEFKDVIGKRIGIVSVGGFVVSQYISHVNALRRDSGGNTINVTWNHNPVLFYFKKAGAEGGPALGTTWNNEGYTSDNSGHGACKADLR